MPKGGRLVAWLAAATALALVAEFGFFFYRDNFATHYPLKVLSAKSFRAGEIPYWNFRDSGGQPLAGNPGAQTFYPDNVLYLFLPAHVAFNLHFLLHLGGAFFAMRALCRARGVSVAAANFAATAYLICGVVVSSTAFYNFAVYAALIPFALYAAERRSWRLLGIACGLMGLAGEPVLILAAAVAIAIAIVVVHRMPLRELALAALVAAIIASPQLIAYWEIAPEVEGVAGVSLLSRVALERSRTHKQRYAAIAELPPVMAVPLALGAGSLREAVAVVEDPRFDPRAFAVVPRRLHGFRSAPVQHLRYQEHGQTIHIALYANGPVLLLVNQSYFAAWSTPFDSFPVDVDRLGILVPPNTRSITLRFGSHRLAVAVAWCASVVLLIAVLAVEVRDRRAREVERAGDDDRALG